MARINLTKVQSNIKRLKQEISDIDRMAEDYRRKMVNYKEKLAQAKQKEAALKVLLESQKKNNKPKDLTKDFQNLSGKLATLEFELKNIQEILVDRLTGLSVVMDEINIPETDLKPLEKAIKAIKMPTTKINLTQLRNELKKSNTILNRMEKSLNKPTKQKDLVLATKTLDALARSMAQSLQGVLIPQPPPASPSFIDSSSKVRRALTDTDGHIQADVLSISAGTNIMGKVYITDGTDDVLISGEKSLYVIDHGLEIARGTFSTMSLVHKFGAAPDFDTGDNEVDITDLAADGTGWENMNYTYSTSAAIDSISSTDDTDTQDIEVQGLNSSYALTTQTITLTGQTRAALSTSLIRVFRMKNVGATDLAGTVVVYENDTTTGGLPDDATLIRGAISVGNNQTEMAIYTIPNGKSGYLRGFYVSTVGTKQTADYLFKLKARPTGQVFQLKHKMVLNDGVDNNYHHVYREPQKFTQKTDLVMTAQILTGSKTAAAVIAGFDIVLIDD